MGVTAAIEQPKKVVSQDGYVRRVDVLLRAHYPNLITRIFETSPERYLIVFDRRLQDAGEIGGYFHHNIRFVTVPVTLSNDLPETYLREIDPIRDAAVARHHEGLPFNQFQLINLIASQFPDLPVTKIVERELPVVISIGLAREVPLELKLEVDRFLENLRLPASFKLVVQGSPENTEPATHPRFDDPIHVIARRFRPASPAYVRDDEQFWHENVEDLFAGRIAPEALTDVRPESPSCYIDFTGGSHLNLRQALLMYETVFCSLPLAEAHDGFLRAQDLHEADLLFLAEKGLLKIVTTQPEERLNTRFLEAVAERSPRAILGRRATAAVTVADLARTAGEYQLNDPTLFEAIGEYAALTHEHTGLTKDELLQVLLWPLHARRVWLQAIRERGTKGLPAVGIGKFFATAIQKTTGHDVQLPALVASEWVHLAHALNATFIPSIEYTEPRCRLMNGIGDLLNFFRSFNTRIAAAWVSNEERKAEGHGIVPPLPLFEFEPDVPIEEFVAAVSSWSSRSDGRALFARLAELPDELRGEEVIKLRAQLRKRYARESGAFLSFENLEDTLSILGLLFGFTGPTYIAGKNLWRRLRELVRHQPSIDRFLHAVETDLHKSFNRNQDLDFLSRINRVGATLRLDRKS